MGVIARIHLKLSLAAIGLLWRCFFLPNALRSRA
jgi:hypothetical protein